MNSEINRTIENILDLRTGKTINATDFFKKSEAEIFKFRTKLEEDIQNGIKTYVCSLCKQHLKISGRKIPTPIYFFKHLKDSEECEIKTNGKLTREEVQRVKYNGAKESDLHYTLKHKIADALKLNQINKGEVVEINIEQVQKDKAVSKKWRKPDVMADFQGNNIALELQLSTTFLSVIVERYTFYRRNQKFILWIFNEFDTRENRRKFTQSDIFYNNNRNGFEFNKKTQKLSLLENDLVLNCHYQKPKIEDNQVVYEWCNKYIKLSDLTFDEKTYKVYYFNAEKIAKELREHLNMIRYSIILRKINQGLDVSELIDYFENNQLSDDERGYIRNLYKKNIEKLEYVVRYSKEEAVIWALILDKLKTRKKLEFIKEYSLRKAVIAILCLKTKKFIGFSYKRQIQISHNLLDKFPEYTTYYLRAIKKYRDNLGVDKNNKLRTKINKIISDNKIEQIKDDEILNIIFPELIKK